MNNFFYYLNMALEHLPILLSIFCLLFVLFLIYALYVWIRKFQYTRERFGFAALFAISSLTLALLTSFSVKRLPWDLAEIIAQIISTEKVVLSKPILPEYILLVIVYIIAVKSIMSIYLNWNGKKSLNQHNDEQKNELFSISSFVKEGLYEIPRIVKLKPSLEVYSQNKKKYVSQLEPVKDTLSWKKQALELVDLSSSSYVFSEMEDWQLNPVC